MVSEPGSSELGSSFSSSTSSLPCHFQAIEAVEELLSSRLCNLFKMKFCSSMACIEAVLSPSYSLMSALKKEGNWKHVQAFPIHCPRRNLPRRKLSALVLVWRLKHEERRCLWHGGFKEKGHVKKEMLVCPFMMQIALEAQGTSTGSLVVS